MGSGVCLLLFVYMLSMFFSATAHAQTLGFAADSYKVTDTNEKIIRGRLEYSNGQGVCDDYFTDEDAMVACAELGHIRSEGRALTRLRSAGNDDFRLDDLLCDGSEASLGDCSRSDDGNPGDHNCRDTEHTGVVCHTEVVKPKAPELSAAPDPEDEDTAILSWTAPRIEFTGHSINYIESIVDRYQLQISEDGNTGWTDVSTGIRSTRREFLHRGLSSGTWYYRIRAVNTAGDGPYSNVAEVTLGGNGSPVFSEGTSATRSVAENTVAGKNIGGPVEAAGSESYLLGGADANSFDIDGTTGQLKTKAALDYEDKNSYSVTVTAQHNGSATSIDVAISVTNVDEPGAVIFSYPSPFQVNEIVTVTLSDPDGPASGVTWEWERSLSQNSGWASITETTDASHDLVVADEDHYLRATATYTDAVFGSGKTARAISNKVPNLNWPPVFDESDPATRSVPENTAAGENIGARVTAMDPERDTLIYSLGGTDANSFDVDSSTGQIKTKDPLDFETKRSYSVTVIARDRPAGAADLQSDTITVTIGVTDEEEEGTITLSSVQPQVDTLLTATLKDPDGDVSAVMWTWEKSTSRSNGWTVISGAAGSSYTPVDDDVDNYLRVKADYTDRRGSGKMAHVISDLVVRVEPPSNNAPAFSAPTATRSVPENTPPGRNVGAPVAAMDQDNDPLTYSLGGTDAASFTLADPTSGQIQTKAPLDYETKRSYSVEITVKDPSLESASIAVTINVINVTESPSSTRTPDSGVTPNAPNTPKATVPSAPGNLMAAGGDGEVTLSWRTPNDGGSAIKYYEYMIDDIQWISTKRKSTTHTITGLINGETYKFKVRAVNSIGPGPESRPVRATPATVPGAPRNLTAVPGDERVTLMWERPVDNGGLPITSYEYSRKEEGGSFGNWISIDNSGPMETNETSYVVTGLKNGTVYSFRVRAVNVVGPGDASAEATAEASTSAFRRLRRVSISILPEFGRTMTRNSLDALTWRLDSVLSGSFERTGMFRLMDQRAGLHDVIGIDMWDDPELLEELSLEELLYGSSFIIEAGGMPRKPKQYPKERPKEAPGKHTREHSKELPKELRREYPGDENMWIEEDGKPELIERQGDIALWGKADYSALSVGRSGESLNWDGGIASGYLGVDRRLTENVLTGLSVALTKGDFDYTDSTPGEGGSGDYHVRMLSVSPYVAWLISEDAYLWGAIGYGRGEIEIDDEEVQSVASSDLSYKSVAAGGSGRVFDVGDTTFSLKGEAFKVWMDVEGDDYLIDDSSVGVHQLRLSMEGSYEYRFASGTWLNPLVEVALRHDGGDGETGTGVEIGGGFLFEDPNMGLSISGRGRWLATHSSDKFSQWGVGGAIILDTGADKRGALFSVAPGWGETSSGIENLWERGVKGLSSEDGRNSDMHLDAEFGYGLSALGGDGLLTPYSGLRVRGDGWRQYRLGSRLDLGHSASLSLETERRQSDAKKPEHGVMLRGKLNF